MTHKVITCDAKTHNRLKAFCGARGVMMSTFVSNLINREIDYIEHLDEVKVCKASDGIRELVEEIKRNGRKDA